MSSLTDIMLSWDLKDAGTKLLALSTCSTTPVQELLNILNQVDVLLSEVGQAPSISMQNSLYFSMKALISDELLKHSDINVKVSVASCLSEITRISAPDAPYNDDQMKEIFQLKLMALRMLSREDTDSYFKALRILDNMEKVTACSLMLDLECDELIADMFKVFLSTIRYTDSDVVMRQMESIMVRTVMESQEIPDELLSILLNSVKIKEEDLFSRPSMLGEKVFMNCNVKLQRFLLKMVRSRNLNVYDYSIVVATICLNAPEDEHVNYRMKSEEESEDSDIVLALVKDE